ncbi:MAG: aldo/keto reductase [Christensenellales bacterium]
MKTRINQKNGSGLSILGYGCMRLPTAGGSIDEGRAIALIQRAAAAGVNYFDTAYIYHRGASEALLGKALAGGLRDTVNIATKLPPFMVGSLEAARKIFQTQLERLRTDHIDYYLLHMLVDRAMLDRLRGIGVMDWLLELKAAGRVRNIGFSFHGTKADFQDILTAWPWDFCQIQYNYLDENNQATKAGLLKAKDLGIPVIVMEPLRGGKLVNRLPEEVRNAFAACDPARSYAEWGLRWVWNHPQVNVVLSGMGDEQQLEENIRVACQAEAGALSEEELAVFERVKAVLLEKTRVPCTACGYCLPCPHGVDIPGCFSFYNDKYLVGGKSAKFEYLRNLGGMAVKPSNASLCQACGKCESHCPQRIPIIDQLKLVTREMEGPLYKPMVWITRKILKVR